MQDNFNILLLTVEDILPAAKPPKIKLVAVDKSEVEDYWSFECVTKSSIENFAFLIRNHLGEIVDQEALSSESNYNKALKKGNYKIWVSAVDTDGLSASDEISIVVN